MCVASREEGCGGLRGPEKLRNPLVAQFPPFNFSLCVDAGKGPPAACLWDPTASSSRRSASRLRRLQPARPHPLPAHAGCFTRPEDRGVGAGAAWGGTGGLCCLRRYFQSPPPSGVSSDRIEPCLVFDQIWWYLS